MSGMLTYLFYLLSKPIIPFFCNTPHRLFPGTGYCRIMLQLNL